MHTNLRLLRGDSFLVPMSFSHLRLTDNKTVTSGRESRNSTKKLFTMIQKIKKIKVVHLLLSISPWSLLSARTHTHLIVLS